MPLEFKNNNKTTIFAIIIFAVTALLTILTSQNSIIGYLYFLFVWTIFILLFDKKEAVDFIIAFLCNGIFTIIYVSLESFIYPESYGTTSPLGSWTDDSHFFSLCADTIPKGLIVRDEYYLYTQFYSDLIVFITPFKIRYPLDIIYFQSGIAAIISTYVKQWTIQWFSDEKLGKMVYYLCIFSPFLMMHGGVILIRDTFVAALFILSLCCINRKRYMFAIIAVVIQFPLRVGTAFILLPLYFIIYYNDIKHFFSKHLLFVVVPIIVILIAVYKQDLIIEYFDIESLLMSKGVSIAGRELFEDLIATPEMNKIFLFIQEQQFIIKSFLSGAYIFFYPFLSFKGIMNSQGIDIRTFLLGLVYPIYLFWLNAWFFSALFSEHSIMKQLRPLLITIIIGFILIGIFSMQSRHKTVLLPLYYIVVAVGYTYSSKKSKDLGFLISAIWIFVQLILTFR
jgi:hypothetical protein